MILWLLALACPRDLPPDGDPHDHEHDVEATPLVVPDEAEDLDPAPDVLHVRLVAARHTFEVGDETIEGYAYNGQVPGPTLRARVGDTLVVELENALKVPTTIHWHGVAVPHDMDGDTWQNDPIEPGERFTYRFRLPAAGTFWYHPHFDTERQVDLGLYGALVVEDPDEPAADHDLVLVLDAWGEVDDHGEAPPPRQRAAEGDDHDHAHGFHGAVTTWTVNGLHAPRATWSAGSVVRARLVNASNTGYVALRHPRVLALDQGLLPRLWEPDRLVLGPGDRAEIEILPGRDDFRLEVAGFNLTGDTSAVVDDEVLVDVKVLHPGPPSPGLPWPFRGEPPTPDPGHTDLVYVLQGDPHTGQWLINGERFPDVTIARIPLGAARVVEVRNLSPTHHPFHVHGHVLEILSVDGVPPPLRLVEDTFDVGIRQTVRALLVADNPGAWMTHCHILQHAHNGMMTIIDVE